MKIKFKLTRNKIIFLLLFFLLLSLIFLYIFYIPKPITSLNFYGVILNFRADLREASKIPVYPTENSINREIFDPSVKNITIAYKQSSQTENSYYGLEAFEITTNLYHGYRILGYDVPHFSTMNISSYDELNGSIQNPIIALVPPSYSNETAIVLGLNHIVFIKAKKLQDFDLATTRFLMSALQIKV